MTSTYLVCRHSTTQVLIPAADVLGVRELQIHAAPPTVPGWVEGVALAEGRAVVVAAVRASGASEVSGPQRVVLLQATQAEAALSGLLVDEVLELRAIEDAGAPAAGTGVWWHVRENDAGSVVIAPARLRAVLAQGTVA